MKTLILSFISLFLVFHLQAQETRVVFGEVSALNNLKLQNIIVESKNTGAKSLTDSLGRFSVITAQKDVLFFKSKVFKQERLRIKPQTDSVQVELEFIDHPDNINLAIGYGYISPDKSTYAHDKLTRSNADFCSYNSMYELIKGRFPGVNVITTNHSPGSEQSIKIRGISTIYGDNTPLFVVDGVYVSSLNQIAPCDVESIDILKDASASIYGTRGANGVIIIETRR